MRDQTYRCLMEQHRRERPGKCKDPKEGPHLSRYKNINKDSVAGLEKNSYTYHHFSVSLFCFHLCCIHPQVDFCKHSHQQQKSISYLTGNKISTSIISSISWLIEDFHCLILDHVFQLWIKTDQKCQFFNWPGPGSVPTLMAGWLYLFIHNYENSE